MILIGNLIVTALQNSDNDEILKNIIEDIKILCKKFPLYKD